MNEPSSRPRILVAEDHQLVLDRVIELLQASVDIVGTARNGREMVSEAMRLSPDIIVTDISMPELDGIEAAHQLRVGGCKSKLVFLTVHIDDEFVKACLAEGALGYVLKAHMKTELITAIHEALSNRCFISATR
jgi:DNA-binding NarL/FixJ family response regulator